MFEEIFGIRYLEDKRARRNTRNLRIAFIAAAILLAALNVYIFSIIGTAPSIFAKIFRTIIFVLLCIYVILLILLTIAETSSFKTRQSQRDFIHDTEYSFGDDLGTTRRFVFSRCIAEVINSTDDFLEVAMPNFSYGTKGLYGEAEMDPDKIWLKFLENDLNPKKVAIRNGAKNAVWYFYLKDKVTLVAYYCDLSLDTYAVSHFGTTNHFESGFSQLKKRAKDKSKGAPIDPEFYDEIIKLFP